MKAKKTTQKHSYQARQRKALLTISLGLLAFFGSMAGMLYWAHIDLESEVAQKIRNFVGIPPAEPHITEVGPPAEAVEAELAPEPKPMPEPEPEPEPDPVLLSWDDFLDRSDLWPESLEITFRKSIPIRYNGTNFGQMDFTPGQIVEVEALKENQLILGAVNSNSLMIAANSTNLKAWFAEEYEGSYVLEFSLDQSSPLGQAPSPLSDEAMAKVLKELSRWCIIKYGSSTVRVEPDSLAFEWHADGDFSAFYRFEAREIARQYLMLQAELGGTDNYASCRILEPRTGKFLGAGSIFIPALTAASATTP